MIQKNLFAALSQFQQIVPVIEKDSVNPHLKSKYAALDSILPRIKEPMAKCGLGFTQMPLLSQVADSPDSRPVLKTIVFHIESGESIESVMPLIMVKNDAQGLGSAITYARRYALVAMLGLNVSDDDDDGHGATGGGRQAQGQNQAQKPAQKQEPNKPYGFEEKKQAPKVDPILEAMRSNKDKIIAETGATAASASSAVLEKVKSYLKEFDFDMKNVKDLAKLPSDIRPVIEGQIVDAAAEGTFPWVAS